MKTQRNYVGFIILIATILASFLGLLAINSCTSNRKDTAEERHYCNWEDCPHVGKIMDQHTFNSIWAGGYVEGTDGFYVELTHFMQPTWSYEQCEDYVMSGVE